MTTTTTTTPRSTRRFRVYLRDRAVGIVVGVIADAVCADPARFHPVAGLGTVAGLLENALHPAGPPPGDPPPGDPARKGPTRGRGGPLPAVSPEGGARVGGFSNRSRGALLTAMVVGGAAGGVAAAHRLAPGGSVGRIAVTGLTVWSCLGGTSLLRVAARHGDLLAVSDIEASRALLPWLCGRDPSVLDEAQLARAVVESVAENTSDAVVATLFWGAVAGPAGAAAHRAANTLDAMVGHRSERYAEFGWASARLDDVLGWPAARLTGALTVLLAPVVGGRPSAAVRAWRRDSRAHPSPNAGVVESTAAGALGVRLGGTTRYSYGVDERPVMGEGSAPGPEDIGRAARLMRCVHLGAATVVVVGVVGVPGARDQLRRRSARRWARRLSASSRLP